MKTVFNAINAFVKDFVKSPKVKIQTVPPARYGQLPRKIVKNFSFKNKLLGDLFVHTYPTDRTNLYFRTEIANKLGKPLASELYQIEPSTRNIYGFQIITNEEYRQKGFRFGEILRLSSIIEMIENCSRYMRITASKSAVYFHAKYKFQSDINDFKKAEHILSSIIKDKSDGFLDLKKEAYIILRNLKKNSENLPELDKIFLQTNALVSKYLERALKSSNPQKMHPFSESLPMILTRKHVMKNKEFFNKLLESHNIEYKI